MWTYCTNSGDFDHFCFFKCLENRRKYMKFCLVWLCVSFPLDICSEVFFFSFKQIFSDLLSIWEQKLICVFTWKVRYFNPILKVGMCQLLVFKKCAISSFMWMFSAALKFLCTKSTRHTVMANKGGAVLKLFVENLLITEVKNRSHTIKPAGSERVCYKKTKTEDFRSYDAPQSRKNQALSVYFPLPITHRLRSISVAV